MSVLVDTIVKEILNDFYYDSNFLHDLQTLHKTMGDQADPDVVKAVAEALKTPALTVPFQALPNDLFIKGPAYKVEFEQLPPAPKKPIPEPPVLLESASKPKHMLEFFAYETIGVSVCNLSIQAVGLGDDEPDDLTKSEVLQNGWSHVDANSNSWGDPAKSAKPFVYKEFMPQLEDAGIVIHGHTAHAKSKAWDAPVAVIEVNGEVIYLPDTALVTLARRPRVLIL